MSRVFVVIPTYNEAENLPLLVPEVLAQDERIEVLVVDDDSPDGPGTIPGALPGQARVHARPRELHAGAGRVSEYLCERPPASPSLGIRDVAEARDHGTSIRPSKGLEAWAYRRRGMRPAS